MVSVIMPLPMILNHKMNLRPMNLVDSSTMLNFFVTFQQLGTNDKTMWSPFKCELLFLTKSAMFKEGKNKKRQKKKLTHFTLQGLNGLTTGSQSLDGLWSMN